MKLLLLTIKVRWFTEQIQEKIIIVQEFSSLLVYFFLKGSSLAFPAPVAKLLYSENLEDQKYKEPKENNHL